MNGLTGGHLSPDELFKIWGCFGGSGTGGRMEWQDLGASFAGDTSEIVPWSMNTSSGTYNTFRDYVRNNATLAGHLNFDPNTTGACVRTLTPSGVPLENDIKNILNDGTLSSVASSHDNPENWMWWGSFGVFSAFPYTSNYARADGSVHTTWVAKSAAINGITPGYRQHLAADLSDQPHVVPRHPQGRCRLREDATGGDAVRPSVRLQRSRRTVDPASAPGTTDLNVTGGTSGSAGAVREYTRFMCRKDGTQQGTDPFTGLNFDTEITAAINSSGFTTIKSSAQTLGSRCFVRT